MTKYQQQAFDFLKACNATMEINYIGKEECSWDDNRLHNKYSFIIITPFGVMEDYFFDSRYNTENDIKPVSTYTILSCLEKYDVGTIDDFVSEFGYEVHCWADVKRIENTYKAVVKQYNKLCEIFTPEQMKMLREIQ